MLTQTELQERLRYSPEDGKFRWLSWTPAGYSLGRKAGCPDAQGYLKIVVNKQQWYAHRLAWLYVYGVPPAGELDHINGDKADNRIENLRPASRSENTWNRGRVSSNTSGYRGVVWCKSNKKWRAASSIGGKLRQLGLFTSPAAASEAYEAYAQSAQGTFYRAPNQ